MGYINKCRTVNGGVIVPIQNSFINAVEVLSHKFHNPSCDIICFYYYDKELGAKVEVTLCKNIKTGRLSNEIYFFRTNEDLQHYYSRNYNEYSLIPKKYLKVIHALIQIHKGIDFNQYNNRPN